MSGLLTTIRRRSFKMAVMGILSQSSARQAQTGLFGPSDSARLKSTSLEELGEVKNTIPSGFRATPLHPGRLKISFLILLLLQAVVFPQPGAIAQPPGPSQSDIQAVYLFDFAKFVRWPTAPENEPLTLCAAAPKPFVDTLAKLISGERIGSRPLAVRRIQNAAEESGCAILFVDSSTGDRLIDLLAATAGKPILTVSDAPDFLNRGGMIQFVLVANRVRFSVDLRSVDRSGIALSSELLKVAVSVNGNSSGGHTQ
jgi:hypothetical protein